MCDFYQIIRLPLNSMHGKIEGSYREKKDRDEYFIRLKEAHIKNGTFQKDVSDELFIANDIRYYKN